MKFAAWLYLHSPMWLVKLLPNRINHSESGKFNEALENAYNQSTERQYRRMRRNA